MLYFVYTIDNLLLVHEFGSVIDSFLFTSLLLEFLFHLTICEKGELLRQEQKGEMVFTFFSRADEHQALIVKYHSSTTTELQQTELISTEVSSALKPNLCTVHLSPTELSDFVKSCISSWFRH